MTAQAVLQPARIQAPHVRLDPAALRHARRAAGMSLAAASVLVRRDASAIARYEKGFIDPPASVLAALGVAYGVDPRDFFRAQ